MTKILTVVIPTCHRNGDLAECLVRLAPGAQTLKAENYAVVVSDDGSHNTAEAMVRERFPWAAWVHGPRRGPAANRNCGAGKVQTDWIAFTDDDCLPDPGWLHAFVDEMREDGPAVLEGCTSATGEKNHPLAQCPINETGGFLWSCNFAIRRQLFVELGGFDERFPYASMEDMDFHTRLKLQDINPRFVSAAKVSHPWKILADPGRYLRQHLYSQMLYLQIHPQEKIRVSAGNHLHYWMRYAIKILPRELWIYRWQLVRALPGLSWRVAYAAGVLWRRPSPEKIKV